MPTAFPPSRRIASRVRRMALPGCIVALAGVAQADPPGSPAPLPQGPSAAGNAALRSHLLPAGDIAAAGKSLPAAGMVTARAPEIVREQLALPRGRGLVVMSVAPDSLAARAGICRHDVLVALDGQWLLLPEHLEALIETSPSDATLECHLIRGGKPVTVSLSGRPLAGASGAWSPPKTPAVQAAAIASVTVTAAPTGGEQPDAVTSAAGSAATGSASVVVPAGASKPVTADAVGERVDDGSLVEVQGDYTIKLTPGAGLRLLVHDRRGRVMFHGPIDTPAQRARMPLAVRTKVEAMERAIGDREYRPQAGTRVAARTAAADRPAEPRPPRSPDAGEPASLPVQPVEIR